MRIIDAARSAPARYALVFAGSSAVVMGFLLALIYWWMTTLLERHLEDTIRQQFEVLRDDFDQDGRGSLLGLVRQHSEKRLSSPVHFLVLNAQGDVLAGDLPSMAAVEGWRDIELPATAEAANGVNHTLLGLGVRLDANTYILITHDTADIAQTSALLVRSFTIALAVTVVLSLVGGLVIGRALLRRVEVANRTAHAIMDGDLSQRIPEVGAGDELGGLAEVMNRMLGRVEELVQNLRHVTSSIAHDLRSPLGRQRQRLEASRFKTRSIEEYEAVIDAAIEDSSNILKTFDAILRIAQIEAGIPKGRFASVDVSGVAENVAEAFAAIVEDTGGQLYAHIEPEVVVRGDRELLTQMLSNLVENAFNHTPKGSTIELSVGQSEQGARIVVSDDGAGIPPDERERVFRRFYRLDASRSTPGNGLGMSLVGAIVELHGGEIILQDNQPGLRAVINFPSPNGWAKSKNLEVADDV